METQRTFLPLIDSPTGQTGRAGVPTTLGLLGLLVVLLLPVASGEASTCDLAMSSRG